MKICTSTVWPLNSNRLLMLSGTFVGIQELFFFGKFRDDPEREHIAHPSSLEYSQSSTLASPAETRMLPVQICASLVVQPSELSIDISLVALTVIPLHVKHQGHAQDKDHGAGGQVQPITNRVVGRVVWYKCPCGDQTAHVAWKLSALRTLIQTMQIEHTEHDVRANGRSARRVSQDVRRHLGVAQRSERKGTGGDDECRAVAHLRVRGSEEHDVSDHYQRGGDDEEDVPSVEAPGQEGKHDCEEGSDYVRWHSAELLVNYRGAGVDCLDRVLARS